MYMMHDIVYTWTDSRSGKTEHYDAIAMIIFNPFGTETRICWFQKVNIVAADAPGLCLAKSTVLMLTCRSYLWSISTSVSEMKMIEKW